MVVYTFWEPREKMPYYIQLCMETWKKNLPNAEIVLLDYKNLGEYVDINKDIGANLLGGRFRLQIIADAIRIAILAKYGGVWLDADTIILNPNAEKYFQPDEKNRTVLFVNNNGFCQMCFINTPPNSKCMNTWLESVKEKLYNLKPDTLIKWYFFGNSFINTYVKNHPEEFEIIDNKIAMPHQILRLESEKVTKGSYLRWYFLHNYHREDISADMLFLQNSWTPHFYKVIPPKVLLRRDCTMTNVLAEALDIKLPPPPKSDYASRSRMGNGLLFPTIRRRKYNTRTKFKKPSNMLRTYKRKAFSFAEQNDSHKKIPPNFSGRILLANLLVNFF